MADNSTKEEMKKLTERLEQGILDFMDGEKFKTYLRTVSKFHNYSLNNTILIALQKPDATYVTGYRTWQSMGRNVKPGEKGLKIFAPSSYTVKKEKPKIDPATQQVELDDNGNPIMITVTQKISSFHPISVFDVSQTEGEELDLELIHELDGSVEQYENMFDAIKDVSPVPVIMENITTGAKGYFDGYKIAVNNGMSEAQTVKTALHELAHAMHEHHGIKLPGVRLSRNAKEVEAESTAFIVANHFGIDTSDYSFGYLASWSTGKDIKELKSSLDKIRKVASDMIASLEEKMKEKIQSKEEIVQAI